MTKNSLLAPLFRTIDKVIFGFQELHDADERSMAREYDNDEEFDAERSTN